MCKASQENAKKIRKGTSPPDTGTQQSHVWHWLMDKQTSGREHSITRPKYRSKFGIFLHVGKR